MGHSETAETSDGDGRNRLEVLQEWAPLSREDLCPPVQEYGGVELDDADTATEDDSRRRTGVRSLQTKRPGREIWFPCVVMLPTNWR